jgi:hypothetical protein
MAYDQLKALLESGILEKITADKEIFEKIVAGNVSDVKAFAKSININLDDASAQAAIDQIKMMDDASNLLNVPGASCAVNADEW